MAELFSDEGSREQAIADLKALLESRGWDLLRQVMDENIMEVEKQLLDDDPANPNTITDPKEVEILRLKRYYQMKLRELPNNLIEVLGKATGQAINADPYN